MQLVAASHTHSSFSLKPVSHSECEAACGTAALELLPYVGRVETKTALGFLAHVSTMMSVMKATTSVKKKQALHDACSDEFWQMGSVEASSQALLAVLATDAMQIPPADSSAVVVALISIVILSVCVDSPAATALAARAGVHADVISVLRIIVAEMLASESVASVNAGALNRLVQSQAQLQKRASA